LGGDGTVLQAVGLLAECEVPVVGVNVGHLGYLTEFDVSEMTSVVQAALAGELPVEHRMMIQATVERGGARTEHAVGGTAADTADGPWLGLNEAVLEKRDPGHTVRMEVLFDGCEFATYAADGLIVSTPTGSTAYNLSAGGSVVDPTHRALQLTPVAPHMLFDRSILVGGDAEIRCRVLGTRSANLAVDGRSVATLDEGDVLVATRAEVAARLVTSDSMSFHAVLKQKLGLKDR
ncbi:MAG TPA: NAD(+) kinase, partial [Acidimicrobiaceae bacterium]|nr:NAD(+) kinase [Acidimicrobiaceae bacterium]